MTTSSNNTATNSSVSSVALAGMTGVPRAAHLSIMDLIAIHPSIMALVNEIIKISDKERNIENQYSNEQQVNSFKQQQYSLDAQKDAAGERKEMGLLEGLGSVLTAGAGTVFAGLDHVAEKGLKDTKWFSKTRMKEGLNHASGEGKKRAVLKGFLPGDTKHRALRKKSETNLIRAEADEIELKRAYAPSEELKMAKTPEEVKAQYRAATDHDLDKPYYNSLSKFTTHGDLYTPLAGVPTKIASANVAADASGDERLAEFDKSLEKYFEKDTDNFSQQARSVSSEMRQAINSLVAIQGKLCDAINIR